MVFTGAQATGKSTLAKAQFYFRTIKDDILSLIIKKSMNYSGMKENNLHKLLIPELREKFLRVFGSSWGMDNSMYMSFYYNQSTYVRISLKKDTEYDNPNYLWIEYSSNIKQYLIRINSVINNSVINNSALSMISEEKNYIKEELNELFSDDYDTIFIPAGRSLITLLATQLNYIYSTMEDAQKRAIDYCTRNYLERILKIRPEFENGLIGLLNDNPNKNLSQKLNLQKAYELISEILKGSYRYNNGEERLEINNNHYVKINFTSSGQQEAVWILNLLFYHLLQNQKTNFIIEEPESHLFPDAQKLITELIALVYNAGNSVFLTTHSPYVLGSLNNLLYASQINKNVAKEVSQVINNKFWIDYKSFGSWFFEKGNIIDGMDDELHMINNELIDGISKVINEDYDRLFNIKIDYEGACN
jgi:predicted ATP-dependent endonuclease of OLD family